jgi:hypothetical protein
LPTPSRRRSQTAMKNLGPSRFGGDANICEIKLVCSVCEGTGLVPPKARWETRQNGPNVCSAPSCKNGLRNERFKTIDELKAFVRILQ